MYDNEYIKKISQLSGLSFNKVKRIVNAQIDYCSINIANSGKAVTPVFTLEVNNDRQLKISINETFNSLYKGQVSDTNLTDRLHDK